MGGCALVLASYIQTAKMMHACTWTALCKMSRNCLINSEMPALLSFTQGFFLQKARLSVFPALVCYWPVMPAATARPWSEREFALQSTLARWLGRLRLKPSKQAILLLLSLNVSITCGVRAFCVTWTLPI